MEWGSRARGGARRAVEGGGAGSARAQDGPIIYYRVQARRGAAGVVVAKVTLSLSLSLLCPLDGWDERR